MTWLSISAQELFDHSCSPLMEEGFEPVLGQPGFNVRSGDLDLETVKESENA